MEITLLGTGSPVPSTERGGQTQLLELAEEPVLVDCGHLATYRLLEHGYDPSEIETLVFTHHHFDHNADFLEFVFGGWTIGRDSLTVIGPEGTQTFVDAIPELYAEDIAYRREVVDRSTAGLLDIDVRRTTEDLRYDGAGWSMTALSVEHSIETYGYRFEEDRSAATCVISSDTRRIDSLVEFARGADVLIQDCGIAPVTSDPPADVLREGLARPMSDDRIATHKQNHCDPEDAGWIAAEADVSTLVLTHLLPYRDPEATRERAATTFDGEIIVGEDGARIPL